jgi:hypothetical protein
MNRNFWSAMGRDIDRMIAQVLRIWPEAADTEAILELKAARAICAREMAALDADAAVAKAEAAAHLV